MSNINIQEQDSVAVAASFIVDEQKVKQVFAAYTRNYNPEDPKIALKIEHTYKVAEICRDIASSLDLCEEDQQIAWLTGMLHDVGRFEQIRIYDTFVDSKSVDHAQFGADLLFGNERLIERFIDSRQLDELVEIAIREHNKFRIRIDIDERTAMFCNILRDADKVDIFRVNVETPMEEIYNCTTEELLNSDVSPEVMVQARNHQAVTRDVKKTPADFIVGHLALAFELVYPRSLAVALEQGYLNKLFDFPTKNPHARECIDEIKNEISERLSCS
ncbi:MAG: HD domain-containing protein [Pseudobutyrivibrio sp.]|nr:HD domain-containing protein [Pseudobutyrivibrio sp.]